MILTARTVGVVNGGGGGSFEKYWAFVTITVYSLIGRMLLRQIFEPKWDQVKGEWRKLHNDEL
jgi:hypothetical protein